MAYRACTLSRHYQICRSAMVLAPTLVSNLGFCSLQWWHKALPAQPRDVPWRCAAVTRLLHNAACPFLLSPAIACTMPQ